MRKDNEKIIYTANEMINRGELIGKVKCNICNEEINIIREFNSERFSATCKCSFRGKGVVFR